jgi:S-adenosylmethionine synthetase
MIRASEMVLPGHPDKFCDCVADAIVAECYVADPRAYCQVEVSVWSDEVWLSGSLATRAPLDRPLDVIVKEAGRGIGYVKGNAVEADRYIVHDTVCQLSLDPREWTNHVNDQCITVGWAGYDAKVDYLPPEHFLADQLRGALFAACRGGRLAGHGPDGKLLVRIRESSDSWALEHVLVTLQHLPDADFISWTGEVSAVVADVYRGLRARDARWSAPWEEVELNVNPNGPLLCGGSDGDNGQTGRKLAMDYYGPRVPIGGGAIFGKDLAHIDRAAAYSAREAALGAVKAGARECKVVLCYAPNVDQPLDVHYEMEGGDVCARLTPGDFAHDKLVRRWQPGGRGECQAGWAAGGRGLRGIA